MLVKSNVLNCNGSLPYVSIFSLTGFFILRNFLVGKKQVRSSLVKIGSHLDIGSLRIYRRYGLARFVYGIVVAIVTRFVTSLVPVNWTFNILPVVTNSHVF